MRAFFRALGLIALFSTSPALAFEAEDERWFASDGAGAVLNIISTTDTAVFAPLIEDYKRRNPGVSIRYVVTNTQELFRAIADEHAAFDVAISSAMDLQMKLANDGFAASHVSANALALPSFAHWRDQLFAFTEEPVVIAYSRRALAGLQPPRTRDELIRLLRDHPEVFAGRIGTYDPRGSGAGYLFASQDARRSDTYWRLSEVMGGLDPRLYVSTSAMIDDLQSGRLALAYNVLGSYLSGRMAGWPDGGKIELRDYTHVLLRTAFVPVNAETPDQGHRFLDFLISEAGQALVAEKTGLPRIDEAALAAAPHLRPIRLDPGLLVYVDPLKQARFLDEWVSAVIQP